MDRLTAFRTSEHVFQPLKLPFPPEIGPIHVPIWCRNTNPGALRCATIWEPTGFPQETHHLSA